VDSAIIGTSSVEHLRAALDAVKKGKLPDEVFNSLRTAFEENDDNWIGQN